MIGGVVLGCSQMRIERQERQISHTRKLDATNMRELCEGDKNTGYVEWREMVAITLLTESFPLQVLRPVQAINRLLWTIAYPGQSSS